MSYYRPKEPLQTCKHLHVKAAVCDLYRLHVCGPVAFGPLVMFICTFHLLQHDENVDLHVVTHPFMTNVISWRQTIRKGLAMALQRPARFLKFADMPRIYVCGCFIPLAQYPQVCNMCSQIMVVRCEYLSLVVCKRVYAIHTVYVVSEV